jgi:hypothetical protein
MSWLESHAYIATWLALPVMIGTVFFQNARTGLEKIDWTRPLIYFVILTCLGVVFTPIFDERARGFAQILLYMGFGAWIMDTGRR